jgi:LysR family glycine cleavage system transcriptional activator
MAYTLPPLQSLRVFEAAARHLSFKRAAEELHVTPAAVSHQIKALEDYLGVVLFRRLTRALELTETGKAMLPKIQEGFECLALAVEQSRQETARHSLRVTLPPSFATRWLMPRLQNFAAAHPEIDLAIATRLATIDVRDPATLENDLRPLREDRDDVEIRYGTGQYPGLRADLIFPVDYVAICNPRFLTAKRPLRHPGDLRYHLLIHDDTIPQRSERPSWPEWLKSAGVTDVDAERGPRFANSGLALDAAKDGLGIALAPRPLVAREVAAGQLAIPFDVAMPSRYAYYLVTPQASADRPEVRLFREWVLAEAAADAA